MKLAEIIKNIIEIEEKEKLHSKKIKEIYFWKILRIGVFSEIMKEFGLYGTAHSKTKKMIKNMTKNITKNLYTKNKKYQNIFFVHGRYFKTENVYKPLYTYTEIEKEKENSEIIYPLFTPPEFLNKNYNYSNIESLDLLLKVGKQKIYNFSKKIFFSEEEKFFLEKLKKEFEEKFGLKNISFLSCEMIKKTIISFQFNYSFYKRFFKKKSPKKIYLVCSYGKEPLIAAAQDLGIEVIEIQHGVMNQYHLGYHFPTNEKINYFPDKILMFGDYWYKNTSLPLPEEKIEIYGYPYMQLQIGKYRDTVKEKSDQVLFISQGTIGKQLTEKAVEFAKENPNFKTVIRLHPGEFSRWETEYKVLFENRNLKNLEISDNNNKNLYEYLCESKYLIGVYSTVIHEALYLEKKVGVLNLPGIEYVKDLIENNSINLFQLNEKIKISGLDNLTKTSGEYYFANKGYEKNE
ncbi:MAG: hypothetical protein ACRC6A_11760 [Fusobacteriaceae bacterium]